MLPWVSLNVEPDGNVRTCCMTHADIGNLRESTLAEIWNQEGMRRLRLDMLAGRENPNCSQCYELERSEVCSARDVKKFINHFDLVKRTKPDGTVENLNLAFWDIKFSNLCNLRCRYCTPCRSTSWHEEAVALGWIDPRVPALRTPTRNPAELWAQLEQALPSVEEIYFSGGEPLMAEEHYKVLKALIERRMFHVRLRYNTNFSVTRFRDDDVMRLWDRFEDVRVCASLDASGRRGEYIRKGLDWDQVVANRERMFEDCPRARFEIDAAITAMNVLHFPDFFEDWVAKGFVDPAQPTGMPLRDPAEHRIQILPRHLKDAALERYERMIERLESRHGREAVGGTVSRFRGMLQFMMARDMSDHLDQFREITRALDRSRGENFPEIFPELAGLF